MPLLRRKPEDKDKKVETARLKVDLALLKMAKALDGVQEQALVAKEELHGRRTG